MTPARSTSRHLRHACLVFCAALVAAVPLSARAQGQTSGTLASTVAEDQTGTGSPQKSPKKSSQPPSFKVVGFFEAGYQGFVAKDTFDATLGTTGGGILGGGGAFTHRSGVFFQVDVTRFKADGERVFVYNSQAYPLGIPLAIEVTPIEFTGGYKFFMRPPRPKKPSKPGPTGSTPEKRSHAAGLELGSQKGATPAPRTRPAAQGPKPRWGGLKPYVGGGIGIVTYKETSDFAASGDDVDDSFTSAHVLGGIEIPVWKWLGAAVEFNYRWVKDALGTAGASKEFGDDDLGGPAFRFKITIGG